MEYLLIDEVFYAPVMMGITMPLISIFASRASDRRLKVIMMGDPKQYHSIGGPPNQDILES